MSSFFFLSLRSPLFFDIKVVFMGGEFSWQPTKRPRSIRAQLLRFWEIHTLMQVKSCSVRSLPVEGECETVLYVLDCKTVRIFAYSSNREQSNKRYGTRWKRRVRPGRDAKNTDCPFCIRYIRSNYPLLSLLRHALPISLLILRKNRMFCSLLRLNRNKFLFLGVNNYVLGPSQSSF